MARAEERLARPLTDGQRQAVAAMLTSGRGVELVVGVARSGKTTALATTPMADDAALVAFLEAARETGGKVVAIGDPRHSELSVSEAL